MVTSGIRRKGADAAHGTVENTATRGSYQINIKQHYPISVAFNFVKRGHSRHKIAIRLFRTLPLFLGDLQVLEEVDRQTTPWVDAWGTMVLHRVWVSTRSNTDKVHSKLRRPQKSLNDVLVTCGDRRGARSRGRPHTTGDFKLNSIDSSVIVIPLGCTKRWC